MNQRIEYIDTSKGICICLVVAFHCGLHYNEGIDNLLGAVRMPLYFFLSGLFFKLYDGFGSFFIKKVNKLLIPFFFYLLTSVALPNFLHHFFGYHFETVVGWPSLYAFVYPEEFPNIPIWFLWCLFISNILFYIIVLVCRGRDKLLVPLVFLLCLTGYAIDYYQINLPAFIDSSLRYFPFFFLGYYTNQRGVLQKKFTAKTLCWALPTLLIIALSCCFQGYQAESL